MLVKKYVDGDCVGFEEVADVAPVVEETPVEAEPDPVVTEPPMKGIKK